MWGNAIERVKALRKRHKVWPTDMNVGLLCHQDGVRLHPTKNGWRHDTPEIVRLNQEAMALDPVAYMALPVAR
jgi:hypothetical protein